MSDQSSETLGQVKWFNNKSGYGFITITDGDYQGKDIFIHHSHIVVGTSQYKYLVQGEYVNLQVEKAEKDGHEYQAINVHGVKGGQLMCETRYQAKINRSNRSKATESSESSTQQDE